MAKLFSPLQLDYFTLKNRIVVSPMCQYSAKNQDGYATDWHLIHLGKFALGGAAAIIQEATAVSPEGRINYDDLGLWEEGQIEKLRQITRFIKENNSVPGIQLAHAGRKGSTEKPWISRRQIHPNEKKGWKTIAPSSIPYKEDQDAPLEMTKEDIERIKTAFVTATGYAQQAGYEIIEIHAAHGYLFHQFLSPLTNIRTDEYGGSYENRIRFLCEVIHEVKKVINQESLWLRVSASDWVAGGWSITDTVKLSQIAKKLGVEVIDVSSGGNLPQQKIDIRPGYQVPFASQIRKETNLITGAVGLVTSATQAEEILSRGEADLIFLARKLLREPFFPLHAADELGAEIDWPNQYLRGKERN